MVKLGIIEWIIIHFFRIPWVLLKKDDPRFDVGNKIHYKGDKKVQKTTVTTNRNVWKTWIVVKLSEKAQTEAYVAVDNVFGRRLACLGKKIIPGQKVALRVGHEDAEVFFLSSSKNSKATEPPAAALISRITEDQIPQDAIRL